MKNNIPFHCCACNKHKRSRNLWMLDFKGTQPGKGWGCVQCGLPSDGAIATICDDCAKNPNVEARFIYDGFVNDGQLIPIDSIEKIPHAHNLALHPEIKE